MTGIRQGRQGSAHALPGCADRLSGEEEEEEEEKGPAELLWWMVRSDVRMNV
jgi:hypothetical protein